MIIVSCSHGNHLGPLIAKKLDKKYSALFCKKFPDSELQVKLDFDPKGKTVVFVQSFYSEVNDCLIEVMLAAKTAKELFAKKVILASPYFPYLRQDKRFHNGEAVSQMIIAGMIEKYLDEVIIMDPHLHRKDNLNEIFKIKSKKLTANPLIFDYIKKKVKNPVIIGPDSESYKWAKHVAEMIGCDFRILTKKRFSSYHVEVTLNKKIDLKDKNVVIVDDIVSTGRTIIEASKILRKLGAKKITCICVHGIFAGDALKKLKQAKIDLVSTNTIPNPFVKIDVSGEFARSLEILVRKDQ